MLNKDGSFQRTARFRGPDLESATEVELIAACARANNVLKRFGSGWALHFEAERREALGYPDSILPEAASWLVDEERRAAFEAAGTRYESRYYVTLTFLHGTISDRRHPVAVPDTPIYLNALLVDASLTGGLEPKLGEQHLRTLTILGFPEPQPPRHPRRAQPPGFRLSLGHEVHRARQDRRHQGADQAAPPVVQQEEVDHRALARGHL